MEKKKREAISVSFNPFRGNAEYLLNPGE